MVEACGVGFQQHAACRHRVQSYVSIEWNHLWIFATSKISLRLALIFTQTIPQ